MVQNHLAIFEVFFGIQRNCNVLSKCVRPEITTNKTVLQIAYAGPVVHHLRRPPCTTGNGTGAPSSTESVHHEAGINAPWPAECLHHRTGVRIIVDQVKEKFGGLRFYYHFYGSPVKIHAFDALGDFSSRQYPADNSIHKEIANIIRKWENESLTVCEGCGERGVLKTELPWICVLCDDCLSKRTNGTQL